MKNPILPLPALVIAILFSAGGARATIVSGTVTGGSSLGAGGAFVKLAPGFTQSNPDNTVGNDTFQSPNLWGFDEDQNILLGSNLAVDLIWSGGAGTLLAGTEVASHYVFFDPLGTQSQTGYVDFDAKILAVLTSTTKLAATDFLANTGVTYLNPGLRGLEAGDSATISVTYDYRLVVDWTASSPGDYVRVLTAHSPNAVADNASTAGLLAGVLGFFGLSRRRQRR